jgi:hypothetical protein
VKTKNPQYNSTIGSRNYDAAEFLTQREDQGRMRKEEG